MTSAVEALLVQSLSSVLDQVYPDQAPNDAAAPYGVFQVVGGAGPVSFLDGSTANLASSTVALAVWHKTRLLSVALAAAARGAIITSRLFSASAEGGYTSLAGAAGVEDLRGTTQNFNIFYKVK